MTASGEFDEEKAIGNYWTDTIYPNDFRDGTGKFFNIVTEETGDTTVEYCPTHPARNRIKLTVTFVHGDRGIREVTLKKFKQTTRNNVSTWIEQRSGPGEPMRFTHFTFEKLLAFLKLLNDLDLANLNQRRIALREQAGYNLDEETQEKIRLLLTHRDGIAIVDEILRNGSITSHDLVNVGYRKKQLELFKDLLSEPSQAALYGSEHGIRENDIEKIWQKFFESNEWIFGFGLDYQFLGILQREAHISSQDMAGREGSIADYLMGAKHFTVLVEVKRPDTPLFKRSRNRAGSWRLSDELIDSVSQILEQKAGWQLKAESNTSGNYTAAGKQILQKTIDPKCILVVGSEREFDGTEQEKAIKLRTFELFRRDSRNIEILTYDELFARAKFIVEHVSRK